MGRIIEYVDVQRHFTRSLTEGVDEAVDEPVFQLQKRSRSGGVLEALQRGLTGQIVVIG